jgi:site-specific DNA recombinase
LATEGAFSVVLCLSPDRLARQYAHQWVLLDELQRVGVPVIFINQPDVSQDPQGQLFLGIQGLFSEYERAMITERLRRGKLYRIRQGQLVHPNPPYGYCYIPISEPDGGRWIVHELEAEVVCQIYQWYTGCEQLTITQIVDRLRKLGPMAPPRGKQWTYSTVQAILKQPAYTGRTHYNRTITRHEVVGQPRRWGRGYLQTPAHVPRPSEEWIEMSVPTLLEQTIWEQAQERLAMNQRFASRNNQQHFYLLRSLLVCDICGRTLAGRHSNGRVTYYCTNQGKNRHPDVEPHRCSVSGEVIEPLVWQRVADLLRNPTLLADAWQSETQTEDAAADEITRLEARQRSLQRQCSVCLMLFKMD